MATPKTKTPFSISEEDFQALQKAITELGEKVKGLTEDNTGLQKRIRFLESQEENEAATSDAPKAAKGSSFEFGGKKYTFSDNAVAKNKVSNPNNLAAGFITVDSVLEDENLQKGFAKYCNENPKNQTIQIGK